MEKKSKLNLEKNKKVEAAVKPMVHTFQSCKTDPFGSYTGVPLNKFEQPVQDADDL